MFFRKNEEKRAREAQAQAEVDRLLTLAPEALAAEALRAFAADDLKRTFGGVPVQAVCKQMLDGFGSSFRVNTGVLLLPVREALQRLEHANLVLQAADGVDNSTRWRITSTGEQALADGDVEQRLSAPAA
jgi:hypothetical protein